MMEEMVQITVSAGWFDRGVSSAERDGEQCSRPIDTLTVAANAQMVESPTAEDANPRASIVA